jgi:hypothetical protein
MINDFLHFEFCILNENFFPRLEQKLRSKPKDKKTDKKGLENDECFLSSADNVKNNFSLEQNWENAFFNNGQFVISEWSWGAEEELVATKDISINTENYIFPEPTESTQVEKVNLFWTFCSRFYDKQCLSQKVINFIILVIAIVTYLEHFTSTLSKDIYVGRRTS